jgi:hypothetical protein
LLLKELYNIILQKELLKTVPPNIANGYIYDSLNVQAIGRGHIPLSLKSLPEDWNEQVISVDLYCTDGTGIGRGM